MSKPFRVSIAGATGAVGREMLALLEAREFPVSMLSLYASSRSAGEELYFRGKRLVVRELERDDWLASTDLCLASGGKMVSHLLKEWAEGSGAVVVDNSSAFRMVPGVPLVVPEVNPEALDVGASYIANPNCSTIQLVLPLKAIHDLAGLKRVLVSTYQSVSGAGQSGIDELSNQTVALFNGKEDIEKNVFPHRIAFNVIPHIGTFEQDGYTDEEMKVTRETRKIMGLPYLPVACTAVRIPTFACHSESVMVELERQVTVEQIQKALAAFPGIRLDDDPAEHIYPMPMNCTQVAEVAVGRVRRDISGNNAFNFWVVADNLWKGAALNAIQIAEELHRRR